jgi:hypothetical protein
VVTSLEEALVVALPAEPPRASLLPETDRQEPLKEEFEFGLAFFPSRLFPDEYSPGTSKTAIRAFEELIPH